MKGMLLAGALTATAALAMPALAQPAQNTEASPTYQTQAAPATATGQGGSAQAGAGQPGAEQGRGAEWMRHRGGSGMERGPMMRRMMMRRMGMMRGDPQQRCIDRLAWRAARYAYIEAKLDLTAQQQPLWDKLESIGEAEQKKQRQLCRSLKSGEEATVLDRMDRAEQFLSAGLDAVHQVKPALQALYQALTPEQQAIINHPFRPD